MEDKRYFLVIETSIFVDPHGSSDEGADVIYITNDPSYLEYDGQYVRSGEIVEDEDLQGSEDGYNSEYESYSVTEITEEQADEYEKIKKMESDWFASIKKK